LRLRVAPSTRIIVDGRDADLTELKIGHVVNLRLERMGIGPHRAIQIEATGETVGGVLLTMDHESITIEGDKFQNKFDLEKTSISVIDGKKVKRDKFLVNMKVKLYRSFGKPGVNKVEAVGTKVVGTVKSVDPKKPSIAVVAQEPPLAHLEEDVSVSPDAPIIIDGKKSQLAKLRPGARVTLHMSAEPGQRSVVGIVAIPEGKKE
jgi:hypothetical protein